MADADASELLGSGHQARSIDRVGDQQLHRECVLVLDSGIREPVRRAVHDAGQRIGDVECRAMSFGEHQPRVLELLRRVSLAAHRTAVSTVHGQRDGRCASGIDGIVVGLQRP